MPAIQTPIFAVTPAAYLPHVAWRVARRFWWMLVPPTAAVIYAAAVADWRWAVVGLMCLLLLYPMVMTLAIIRCAASDRILRRANTGSVRVEREDDSIVLFNADGRETDNLPFPPYPNFSGGYLVLAFSGAPDDILLIPREAANGIY